MGQKNLFASLEDLIEKHGMDEATEILIVGNAASGAIALLWQGDRMAEFIKERVPGVSVYLVADSAWLLDQNSYPEFEGECRETDPTSCRLEKTLGTAMKVYDPEVPADCEEKGLTWECLLADVRAPMLETPMFHAQYLYDVGQLGLASFPDAQKATNRDWRRAHRTVARPFRKMFQTLHESEIQKKVDTPDGFFAVSCYQHGFLTLDSWLDVEVKVDGKGINVSEALLRWLEGEKVFFVDEDYEHVFCEDTEDTEDTRCNRTCSPSLYVSPRSNVEH